MSLGNCNSSWKVRLVVWRDPRFRITWEDRSQAGKKEWWCSKRRALSNGERQMRGGKKRRGKVGG